MSDGMYYKMGLYKKYGLDNLHNPVPPPDVNLIKLHFTVTIEALKTTGWVAIGRELERMLRAHEDFYEYVNEPDEHPVEWSFMIEDMDGGRRDWTDGDVIRPRDVYVVAIATFEAST